MSSKFFGNKTLKQADKSKGSKPKFNTQNKQKTAAVRKAGRGK